LLANSALFVYVSTLYVETFKKLDYNQYLKILSGPDVMHQTVVQEFLGSIPSSGKDCMFDFFVLLLLCFNFFPKTYYLS